MIGLSPPEVELARYAVEDLLATARRNRGTLLDEHHRPQPPALQGTLANGGDMRLSFEDGWLLLYHYAVVMTGAYAVRTFGLEDQRVLLLAGLLLAVAWTGYFRFRAGPKLIDGGNHDGS